MDLLSSLLVYQDGQLVPASSASSQQPRVAADESIERDAATAGESEEVRPQKPGNVVNTHQKRHRAQVHEYHANCESSSRAKRKKRTEEQRSVETESSSAQVQKRPETNVDHGQTYSLFTTTEQQHRQAQQDHLTLENMPPPSAQLSYPGVIHDGGHDLGLTHESDPPDEAMSDIDHLDGDAFVPGPIAGHQSVVDFEAAHPYTPPLRMGVPRRLSQNNGVHTSTFWMACQERGLKSEFKFRTGPGCFYVSLTVQDKELGEVGPYASKKDAKEAICKENLSKLESFGNCRKRQSSGHHQELLSSTPEGFEDENWPGVLNEYLQTMQLPSPQYDPSGVHPSMGPWSCTVRFRGSPSTPFGYGMGPFARKDEAKKVAAMEAVQWLRREGKLSASANKRRKSDQSPTTLAPADTGLTQTVQRLKVKAKNTQAPVLATKSLAQQVHQAALRLGFTQPAFPTQQLDGAFVHMWATFNAGDANKEPRLAGEVCRVGPVFGKKTAKEECCRELLRLLGEIERSKQTLLCI